MNDLRIAQKYINKSKNAASKGQEFALSFTSFKNMCNSKRCYYTGVKLTDEAGGPVQPTDRTIDRIDARLGYVSGNVVACSHVANTIKGTIESGHNGWNPEIVRQILSKMK